MDCCSKRNESEAVQDQADQETIGVAKDAPVDELAVQGMTCQNCRRHVLEAIEKVDGVASAAVDLESGTATIRWRDAAPHALDAVIGSIKAAGFQARQSSGPVRKRSTGSPGIGWKFNVVFGLFAFFLLLAGEWIFSWGQALGFRWFSFALALPVQVFCGARFYRGAWMQLKSGNSNMDTLVSLGSTAAFGFSVWELLAGQQHHLFFLESVAIITLISVGHWLESIMSAKAASTLQALMHLAPEMAWRLGPAGEEQVLVSQLTTGDRMVLRPGDRVPTDGEVIEGQSAVDESMLTGESMPVEKTIGARLYTGTLNQDGRLIASVTAIGQATALAKIIEMVARAQNSRAQIQRLGDRVSSVFVPVVILVALATLLWWGLAPDTARQMRHALIPMLGLAHVPAGNWAAGIICATAVLIVACPCAMGLATPAAIMAGTNAAARKGILIRDGLALEKSGQITAVAFDKTGTLTTGRITVAASEDFRSNAERHLGIDQLAASLAAPSHHPLSRAMSNNNGDHLPVIEWQEIRGSGVQAYLDGGDRELVRLGSIAWLQSLNVSMTAADRFVATWSAQGVTVLGLAAERRLLGAFALRDTLKEQAPAVVAQLSRQGKSVFLISGDHRLTAQAFAREAGIAEDHVFAEVPPDQKAEKLRKLQQRGDRVAYVGDGINDAPALEQADLGIAVSRASDVAREAADIILLNSEIQAIPEALSLAQATLRTIKQNLFWAFFYNAAAIPLAAAGLMSPILCAAAMGLSDLVVIGNALRLNRRSSQGWRPGSGAA
jgi:P-type Cu+ transporter